MILGKVVGNVWATRKHENFSGSKMLLVQPLNSDRKPAGTPLAAVDTVGAGVGELIFYITAKEAIIAMHRTPDHLTPCDAAIVGIVEGMS
ncbi:MAG: EutN/CcmL family microcompartment protein [Planctomycetota bacterium]|nr:EutN/CcmL family microcompartment protein [Planctomycetota bacterium]